MNIFNADSVWEYGLQYDSFPQDVVFGRETNEDGSVTKVMWMGTSPARAMQALNSPAPLGGFNKKIVRRIIGPVEEVEEYDLKDYR